MTTSTSKEIERKKILVSKFKEDAINHIEIHKSVFYWSYNTIGYCNIRRNKIWEGKNLCTPTMIGTVTFAA